jgi:hypothetical protein
MLFIHTSVDGYLFEFHLLAIMNNVAMNIHTQLLVWAYGLISLDRYLQKELLGHMVTP